MPREKKHATMNFRTQPALSDSFDAAFERQKAYSNKTAYFEDCMRALVNAVRGGKEIEPPIEFVTKK